MSTKRLGDISELSDSEIGAIYHDMQANSKFDRKDRRHFKECKGVIAMAIKEDKKRSRYVKAPMIGKIITIVTILLAVYLAYTSGFEPYLPDTKGGSMIDIVWDALKINIDRFMEAVPYSKMLLSMLVAGICIYILGKLLLNQSDKRMLRRLMVAVIDQELTFDDVSLLRVRIRRKGNSIRDAMVCYPLRDYLERRIATSDLFNIPACIVG